ncbi:cytochrome P450 [Purpureocillium lavendulum]|uniref:Cytochrome P450 n=1 Tax=Purpureocillium lavendulum TaxID=1247861 RepID=A0AB34FHH5_9HYPO|nr:cytochrome P450 [Purpureocillium lavendulum]
MSTFGLLRPHDVFHSLSGRTVVQGVIAFWVIKTIVTVVYRLLFHPLAHIPGPKLAAVSDITFIAYFFRGDSHVAVLKWHEQYGPVVRIGPNELSFNNEQAWKEIYGTNKTRIFVKDRYHPARPVNNKVGKGIVLASGKDHARQRRLLSHAFSENALRQQEALIRRNVDLFMERVDESWEAMGGFDAAKWFNLLTFDVVGDLAFGEPFGCLGDSAAHRYTVLVGEAGTTLLRLNLLRRLWVWRLWFPRRAPPFLVRKVVELQAVAREKLDRRLQRTTARADLIGYILTHQTEELTMEEGELRANASTFISAGSETTASALSGIAYYLSLDPSRQQRLRDEINATFPPGSEVDLEGAAKMEYLNAVIQEGLRLFPPVCGGLHREALEDTFVCGIPIAKGTIISSNTYAAANDERNFTDAKLFVPERWLANADPRYAADSRGASQPFSTGAKGCIGKNLAYAEMRLTLCRLVGRYYLDFAAPAETKAHWDPVGQRAFLLWQKKSLVVRLRKVAG